MKFNRIFKKTKMMDHSIAETDLQETGEGAGQTEKRKKTGMPRKPEAPAGILNKCNACKKPVFAEEVKNAYYICPHCGNYFHIPARTKIAMIADEDSFEEWDGELYGGNPLEYRGYEEKLKVLQEKTGLKEAVITGRCRIEQMPAVIGVCDGRFMMASMGAAVGEKITRAVERATKEGLPVLLFCCSGGARMQEGIISLMQMAKTSAALKRHSDAGLPYISILTDPTMGGVTASFAMLGDVILAEPGALVGFAGPRVIEQTIGQKLPRGFQRAEFLLEHGFVDCIAQRREQKQILAAVLGFLSSKSEEKRDQSPDLCHSRHILKKDRKQSVWEALEQKQADCGKNAWELVQYARSKDRPTGRDFLELLFEDFLELHGDRLYGDDPAMIGGIARLEEQAVMVLVQEKGSGTRENIRRNFGMVSPEGYRKSRRLMKLAEKFHLPVVCLVDTPGAFCGLEAEERGQGEAIAGNIYELSGLHVPVLSIVIGEGGSGGALALAAADEVWMMENSIYSILSPEGFASILWKDSKRAPEAAGVMRLTAEELKKMDIVDHVICEESPLTREKLAETAPKIRCAVKEFLQTWGQLEVSELLERRYRRFRKF